MESTALTSAGDPFYARDPSTGKLLVAQWIVALPSCDGGRGIGACASGVFELQLNLRGPGFYLILGVFCTFFPL